MNLEQNIKMALYEMAIELPTLAKNAQTFLMTHGLDTVAKITEAVVSGTLTESAEAETMSVKQMIDVLLSTEQTAQFS